MSLKSFIIVCSVFIGAVLMIAEGNAQYFGHDQHVKVSLRMVAHQVLLSSGDSISRVLPIVNEGGRYRIQLESEFEFSPEELVATIDRAVKETNLANHYIVEVEKCKTLELVYSFEMRESEQSDIIPCSGRIQPKSCYNLLFTIINNEQVASSNLAKDLSNIFIYIIIIAIALIIPIGFLIIRKQKPKTEDNPNLIALGEYQFDKRNMNLLIKNRKIDLTSKESDLLLLLYNAANTTVEREVLLNNVWGDEGDYVGRTLDVFISKLRKKLEFDAKVRIVNIRSVGYKLVMDI